MRTSSAAWKMRRPAEMEAVRRRRRSAAVPLLPTCTPHLTVRAANWGRSVVVAMSVSFGLDLVARHLCFCSPLPLTTVFCITVPCYATHYGHLHCYALLCPTVPLICILLHSPHPIPSHALPCSALPCLAGALVAAMVAEYLEWVEADHSLSLFHLQSGIVRPTN